MSSLLPRSVFAGLAMSGRGGAGATGIAVAERTGVALATVMVRKGQAGALASRIRERFGIDLPPPRRYAAAAGVAFAWSGPGHWLAIAEQGEGHRFEAGLRESLGGLASVTDQSDGRVVIRVSGPAARDLLARALPIDLHPCVFGPGATASTVAAHIGVQLWQVDDAPTYELAVFRGFAASFVNGLSHFSVSEG